MSVVVPITWIQVLQIPRNPVSMNIPNSFKTSCWAKLLLISDLWVEATFIPCHDEGGFSIRENEAFSNSEMLGEISQINFFIHEDCLWRPRAICRIPHRSRWYYNIDVNENIHEPVTYASVIMRQRVDFKSAAKLLAHLLRKKFTESCNFSCAKNPCEGLNAGALPSFFGHNRSRFSHASL